MTTKDLKEFVSLDQKRNAHNRDLIRRMRNGESLTSFNSESSWFPPRPVIEKDQKVIAELYQTSEEPSKVSPAPTRSTKAKKGARANKVVKLIKE